MSGSRIGRAEAEAEAGAGPGAEATPAYRGFGEAPPRSRAERRILAAGRIAALCGLLSLASGLLGAPVARAVLIAGPDGSINTTAPDPDPGFDHVGRIGGLSGVYLDNGWVVTASHVGAGSIVLQGVSYAPVPGSEIRLTNADAPDPDLVVFKLYEEPPLPALDLPSGPVAGGESVIMVGNGRNRGAATTWEGVDGWQYASGRTMRWGTNRVGDVGVDTEIPLGSGPSQTRSFILNFDELRGPARDDPEGQAVPGDSGGAVFAFRNGAPELIGLLFAQSLFVDQPAETALFGQSSLVADLHFYQPQIQAIIQQPECADGLDNDGDGLADHPDDPGCEDALDPSELDPAIECDNGLDDDGDSLVDWPEDDGCDDLTDASEVPEPGRALALSIGAGWIFGLGRWRQRARFHRPRSMDSAITLG